MEISKFAQRIVLLTLHSVNTM